MPNRFLLTLGKQAVFVLRVEDRKIMLRASEVMVRFEEVGLLLLEMKRVRTQFEGFCLVGGGPQVM